MLEAEVEVLVPWLRREKTNTVWIQNKRNMNIKSTVCQTFFADKIQAGGAEIIIEFPRFMVLHPSDVHTVLVVLPVVGLVGPPWEEVLREDKNSPHWNVALTWAASQSYCSILASWNIQKRTGSSQESHYFQMFVRWLFTFLVSSWDHITALCITQYVHSFITYCRSSIGVNKLVFNIDIIQSHPGWRRHVTCR